uniref:Uncharacterized protein n=1 Tax=Anguilla anguilla TaxID=7936 RepID=A0A0E9Q9C1_ANGAN
MGDTKDRLFHQEAFTVLLSQESRVKHRCSQANLQFSQLRAHIWSTPRWEPWVHLPLL